MHPSFLISADKNRIFSDNNLLGNILVLFIKSYDLKKKKKGKGKKKEVFGLVVGVATCKLYFLLLEDS